MKRTKIERISLVRMSKLFLRIATGLIVLILVWSCGTVPGLQEESAATFIRIPFVRVLLEENAGDLKVSTQASFAIECLRDGQQVIYYSGQPVTVKNDNFQITVYDFRGEVIEEYLDEVNIIPRGRGNYLRLGNQQYRGILRILPQGEIIRVVNIVYMEDYLRGVVPPEIGRRNENEIEAVKAQAVAARTYAMSHLKQYEHEPYDMKSSIMDQLYYGVDVEDRLIDQAIDQTAGRVIVYHDKLINAYYHSTCGGRTDNIADVWDRKEVAYLKTVDDSGACSWSKYYTWREMFTELQLRGRIEHYLSADRGRDLRIGPITDLVITDRTAGGRVGRLLVHTETDVYRFSKDRIRWVISRSSNPDLILPSDRFDIHIDRDNADNIRTVTFIGRGYGHGVGMCQCGAIGYARAGWEFSSILKHYYTGVEIKKLY